MAILSTAFFGILKKIKNVSQIEVNSTIRLYILLLYVFLCEMLQYVQIWTMAKLNDTSISPGFDN